MIDINDEELVKFLYEVPGLYVSHSWELVDKALVLWYKLFNEFERKLYIPSCYAGFDGDHHTIAFSWSFKKGNILSVEIDEAGQTSWFLKSSKLNDKYAGVESDIYEETPLFVVAAMLMFDLIKL